MSDERDGFSIQTFEGKEVHFVACDKDDPMRERVLAGLLRKSRDDLMVIDTREEMAASPAPKEDAPNG